MKKAFLTIFMLACSICLLNGVSPIELEWNPRNPADIPFEIEVNRVRLNAAIPRNATLSVSALDANGKKTTLDVFSVPGRTAEQEILHFQVPAGTEKLFLEAGKANGGKKPLDLFASMFPNGRWQGSNLTVKQTEGKLVLSSGTMGYSRAASSKVPIPEGLRGKPVRFALRVKSLSPLAFGSSFRLRQYDAAGKQLPECIADPRWSNHIRPPRVESSYHIRGWIRPDAVSANLEVELAGGDPKYDSAGKKIEKQIFPVLEIAELALTPARELPFPKVSGKLFVPGVSGEKNDHALYLTGKANDTFMHITGPQAFWAENTDPRDPAEWFWPTGDGTAELWLKPEKTPSRERGPITLFSAAHCYDFFKWKYQKPRGTILDLDWIPEKKQAVFLFKDAKDREVKGSFPLELAYGEWMHFAFQWSAKRGVEVFVDGKRKFHDAAPAAGYDLSRESIRPAAVMPQIAVVGGNASFSRGANWRHCKTFRGAVDALRISSGIRYDGDFTPAKKFTCDADTRALYDFDRTIEGRAGNGSRHIVGVLDSQTDYQEHFLRAGNQKIKYTEEKLPDEFNPAKVFKINNYPVLPTANDFNMARERKQLDFKIQPGEKKEVNLSGKIYMDYVELSAKDETLRAPLLVNEGEADPRSFADIADSLKLNGLTERERAYRIFSFIISASDYFITHQAMFPPDSNVPFEVPQQPMLLLNGYCAFECGPLNGMVTSLFVGAGSLPAGLLNGYGHTFQQGYFDGGNRLYDLSAQKFFPKQTHDGEAGLDDLEKIAGPFRACGNSCDHFIRIGLRATHTIVPKFQRKVSYDLRPGETIRFYFYNRGEYNNLHLITWQMKRYLTLWKENQKEPDDGLAVAEDVDAKLKYGGKLKIRAIERVLPHYSVGTLRFAGKPDPKNPAFRKDGSGKLIYRVDLPYTILSGTFKASAGGKALVLEFSTDGGKTFDPLPADADGASKPTYAIRARQSIELRMPGNTDRFESETRFQFNSRVQTGRLHDGVNKLVLRSENSAPADVRIRYRKDRAPVKISGGFHSGVIPGNERQLAAIQPGETKSFAVSGVSGKAKVRTSGPFSAKIADGKLIVKAQKFEKALFGAVMIEDEGAVRELTLIGAPDIRLIGADQAKTVGKAEPFKADGKNANGGVLMRESKTELHFPVGELPAGKYQIWLLLSGNVPYRETAFFHCPVPGGKPVEIGREVNEASDFLKAKYGMNGLSRWKWDYPVRELKTRYKTPAGVEFKEPFREVVLKMRYRANIRIGALLILPQPSREFRTDMVKILCGLNCEPWKIEQAE